MSVFDALLSTSPLLLVGLGLLVVALVVQVSLLRVQLAKLRLLRGLKLDARGPR